MDEANQMIFFKKSQNFEKTENLKKCLAIFTRKKLKKAMNIWKKRFTTPLQNRNQRKKGKIDEIQIKIKFLTRRYYLLSSFIENIF